MIGSSLHKLNKKRAEISFPVGLGEKESKKFKPGTVKIPKLKKVSGSDSYKITTLGRQYLTLIEA